MRILVTGGSGFIGTNLVALLAPKHEVVSFDARRPRTPVDGFTWRKGSVLAQEDVDQAFKEFEPEVVFHLAARTDLDGRDLSDYTSNTQGVVNLINSASRLSAKPHTVYASSRLVFDINYRPNSLFDYKPSTVYGESKVAGETIIRESASRGGTWTVVRPTSIWGPWFGVPYRDFFDRVRRRQYVHLSGVRPRKSYGYVGNAVFQLERLALADKERTHGAFFWLSDYEAIDLTSWADMIADAFGVDRPFTLPVAPIRLAAAIGDLGKRIGWRNPPLTSFRLNNLRANMEYDISATQEIVGELPFSVQDGVDATVRWMLDGDDSSSSGFSRNMV